MKKFKRFLHGSLTVLGALGVASGPIATAVSVVNPGAGLLITAIGGVLAVLGPSLLSITSNQPAGK